MSSRFPHLSQPRARRDLSSAIVRAVDAMPPTLRQVFSWVHYEDLPEQEIARRLGLSRASEARALLKEANQFLYESLRTFRQRRLAC